MKQHNLSTDNQPQAKKRINIKRSTLKRIYRYVFQYKYTLLIAFVLMLCSNLLALVGPKLAGYAIDAIGTQPGNVHFAPVFQYVLIMLGCYILSSVLSYILSRLMIHLSRKITYTLRREVFEHLITLPVGYFDKKQTGEIVSHLSYDINTINASLSSDLLQFATSAITVIVSFLMMLSISPVLLIVFTGTIPALIFFTRYRIKKVRPLFKKRSALLGILNGYGEEMLSGQKIISAYHREEQVITAFSEKNTDAVDAHYNADYQGSVAGPSTTLINNLTQSFISILGAALYLCGKITPGNISSFLLYSRKFSGPINESANILSDLQSSIAAAERVFALLDEKSEPKDAADARILSSVEGDVTFSDINFGYDADKIILHHLNFSVPPGKTVAIVGPTGAGKTTIINLLMRFYDPNSGCILLDGQDISVFTRTSLRRAYTMVLQDTWLFGGTVFDNIAYGKENATMEEVVRAAKTAHIHSFIESLPDGYHTVLREDGINISKGQKQLLTIARAMLASTHMLILDEATSNVDSRTEKQIQNAMQALMKDKTCFVIAHRLSTVENADWILVVQNGDIVEQGTHQTLLKANGFYASIYNAQFS